MKSGFTILVADRNPNVREFLKRELNGEGYRVRLAKNGHEVLERAFCQEPLDLLILDLDLPDADEFPVLERLQNRIPTLPVVIYTFLAEYLPHAAVLSQGVFVEKEGINIERLKRVAEEVLQHTYPSRSGQTTPASRKNS